MQKIANSIPHEFRKQILEDWLPVAKASMASPEFVMLWDAYFIYIDPDAVKKTDCPICLGNVKKNWLDLKPYLEEAERNHLLFESI